MKTTLINTAVLAALGLSMAQVYAEDKQATDISDDNATYETNHNMENDDMNLDPIDDEDFVDTASAKGIAEIETARMALEEGSPEIHDFANRVIKDHKAANRELKTIAQQQNMEVADEPTLMDRAKAMILSVRDGESFDEAYIKNQINAHEETIKLFQRASQSDNSEIQAFANEKLPTLREHLKMANELKAQYDF